MKTNNIILSEKTQPLPKINDKQPSENEEHVSGDIHKVVDRKVVPTRAPSQVEQDISPGVTTKK